MFATLDRTSPSGPLDPPSVRVRQPKRPPKVSVRCVSTQLTLCKLLAGISFFFGQITPVNTRRTKEREPVNSPFLIRLTTWHSTSFGRIHSSGSWHRIVLGVSLKNNRNGRPVASLQRPPCTTPCPRWADLDSDPRPRPSDWAPPSAWPPPIQW